MRRRGLRTVSMYTAMHRVTSITAVARPNAMTTLLATRTTTNTGTGQIRRTATGAVASTANTAGPGGGA